MSAKTEIGVRLALRREGEFVNAYAAPRETMEGAVLLASVHPRLVEDDEAWERWKELMGDLMADAVQQIFDARPDMVECPAPPHEKAGNA